MEYELALSMDVAFFPLALVKDAIVELKDLIEISANGKV